MLTAQASFDEAQVTLHRTTDGHILLQFEKSFYEYAGFGIWNALTYAVSTAKRRVSVSIPIYYTDRARLYIPKLTTWIQKNLDPHWW